MGTPGCTAALWHHRGMQGGRAGSAPGPTRAHLPATQPPTCANAMAEGPVLFGAARVI